MAADPHRPVASIADALLHDVVFQDQSAFGGEHPLLAMLRSAGHDAVRDQFRASYDRTRMLVARMVHALT
ncbi:hypothetical protein BOX37_19765 [Nocardia mangyaensis]|uniref:Uncharacterized protein n=1 Tax=Nocardia mangyaensis TaxID=2213200 RepID=A0A1J0VUW4_9NOCA|nr:hypothetical protein [Nocardia mangyaensis]APE35814.1 hypothetical protein BOX37_19765 [Nocardia mangyaensis]